MSEANFTLKEYPLSSPFCVLIEVSRNGERKKAHKTYESWALAAYAAGAALDRLLPESSKPQWRSTIEGMKNGYTPKVVPTIGFAAANWSIAVYPDSWYQARINGGLE